MNRTKEYTSIVLSFNLPQAKQPSVEHKIPTILSKPPKLYDASKLNSIPRLTYIPKSLQDEKVKENINDEIKRLIRIRTIEIQKLYDKNKKKLNKSNASSDKNNNIGNDNKYIGDDKHSSANTNYISDNNSNINNYQQDVMLIEANEVAKRNVNIQQRERIEEQINELGQIMCDITMHVEAQGEKLKRIDDATIETEDYLKKSYYEINRMWERVKGRREVMIKYFVFWLVVCLIIYVIKKIF